jgi:Kef-type K+ transport system membrane component KefB
MNGSETHIAMLVLLFGGVTVLALGLKAALQPLRIPPLIGYLAVGVGLRLLETHFGLLGEPGREIIDFLAKLGVIALLFRVGLESDLPGLVSQLGCATVIWLGNILASAAAGYIAARYLLGFELIPSIVIAVAMTATSVGIPARIWQNADALDSDNGERFLDVAELDDISGVVFMALLFAVLPTIKEGGDSSLLSVLAGKAGIFALKLIAFAAVCVLFSLYVEKRFTRLVRRIESGPDPMLVVVSVGVLVAAVAGLLGFSMAIGAFLAGLVFSRDPQSVKVDASFAPLYDLFTPFFFVGIGLAMNPGLFLPALGAGGVLLLAAVVGKFIGTAGSARYCTGWYGAGVLGVSLVPRAEITMLIMHRAADMGNDVVPGAAYGGMVLVSAATCLLAPPLLSHLLECTSSQSWC